ncbi:Katanin p60 ATPase-containing subunit A-like 2 [Blastocladiella emersonii ATCC 22665]|nr:Katanin p60 ATPase-containing subunit A-like 2 [Blastocladiella emersonii ATCC 22665]
MSESSLTKLQLSRESRELEEKSREQRKVGALVLILHHLVHEGFIHAAQHLERESGVSMSKYEVADNVDLLSVLQEFESNYTAKFNRIPKLFRRIHANGPARLLARSSPASAPTPPGEPRPRRARQSPPVAGDAKPRKLKPLSMAEAYKHLENLDGAPTDAAPATRKSAPPPASTMLAKADSAMELSMTGTAVGGGAKRPAADHVPELDHDLPVPHGATPDEVSLPFQRLLKAIPYPTNSEFRDLATIISRDIYQENPNVRFADIAGLDVAKRLIREAIVFPIRYPELFQPANLLSPWRGILLYGQPGTGKTLLAKAIATECKTTFFHVSASSLVSKWRGDSEKLVRVLFELARHHAPSTIFLDEVESIMSQRGGSGGQGEHEGSRRMKTELLTQLDGMVKNEGDGSRPVFFLAATNLPWELDVALLRRLEKRIHVALPDPPAREQILRSFLPQSTTDAFNNVLVDPELDYAALAGETDGWSGSDLRLVAKEALMIPLRTILAALDLDSSSAGKEEVTTEMVREAMTRMRTGDGAAWAAKYDEWTRLYASV